uniref:Uncharacterized protein n=1 Tax=Anguilla anguilla TaxID=7936 RepID=A0A0E9XII8_ANGAN
MCKIVLDCLLDQLGTLSFHHQKSLCGIYVWSHAVSSSETHGICCQQADPRLLWLL